MLFRFKRLDREVHVLLYSISPQQKLSCTSRKKMSNSVKKEKGSRVKSPLAADVPHLGHFSEVSAHWRCLVSLSFSFPQEY